MAFSIRSGRVLGTLLLGATLVVLGGGAADAQIGNQPYRPGGGVGISNAARQAIQNDRILGSRPRNLVRGADGSLLDVSRTNNQAFARSSANGAFLSSSARYGAGWPTGLGTGLGWGNMNLGWGGSGGGGGSGYGRSSFASESMMQWISMLSFGGGPAFTPSGSGSTPLDIWIGQREWE
jgi:hypothetical protein